MIENSIYGVDIQPIAVQISKLRFFISLIVEQKVYRDKENFGIKPLPNLETKFVAANTLIGIEKPEQTLFAVDKDIKKLEDELKEIRHKIFRVRTTKTKRKYQEKDREIRKLIAERLEKDKGFDNKSAKQLANWDPYDSSHSAPFFDMEWMFGITDGFDIVIGNPPYVRQEKIRVFKEKLKNYEVYNSTSDLYTYFYEIAYNLLEVGGVLSFISSNKWMRAKYGERLRKFFKDKTTIKQIIDFNGYSVFEATVDTNILIFQKVIPDNNIINVVNIKQDFTKENDINQYIKNHTIAISQPSLDDSAFVLADETTLNLKKKIERVGTPLKDWDVSIFRGVLTGFNKAFIIDTETKEKLCKEDPKSAEIIKPILRGRDIRRYSYKWAGLWVIFISWHFPLNNDTTIFGASKKSEEELEKQYPAIFKHLSKYKYELSNRNKDETCIRYEWYALQRCAATYYLEFEKEKIVWNRITSEIIFSFVPSGFYVLDSTFFITGKSIKYLNVILNSNILKFWIKNSTATLGTGSYGAKIYIENAPIPKISEFEQKPFINFVDQILAITKDDDYLQTSSKQTKVKEYEKQINRMVYKLYNLTEEEIEIIEGEK